MTWKAPEVRQLVEDRLRRARLELMRDSRLEAAAQGRSTETPAFIQQIVEDKLSAAARSGYEAAAASLRLEAAAWLRQRGHATQDVRDHLRQAEEACLSLPDRAKWQHLPTWLPNPMPLAAGVFALLGVAVLIVWLILDLPPLLVATLVALAGVPAFAAKAGADRFARVLTRNVAREYPARLCRQYLHALESGVADYEIRVAALASDTP